MVTHASYDAGTWQPATPGIDRAMEDSVGENQGTVAPKGDAPAGGTFVSRLTAQGRGAIAVVRVCGPRAIEIADAVFRQNRGVRLAETPRGVLRLGHIGQGPGDEVVAVVLEEVPPTVEVQCHGGEAAVSLVVEALQAAGANWFDAVSFGDQCWDDPFAHDALVDLARAPTLLTAEILLDQVHGALRRALHRLSPSIDEEPDRVLADIETLIRRSEVGLRLLDGWRVVIAGRPNVGKSRLFNALVGFARAIVDPTPGTTRDLVSFKTSFAGWPVELVDTAGLRETLDPIETIGIEHSRLEQRQSDLILLVLDRSLPLELIDLELVASNPTALLVGNKSDLDPGWNDAEWSAGLHNMVFVSAETGEGLTDLIAAIVARLIALPQLPGAAVPFRAAHVSALLEIRASLIAGDRAAAAGRLALMFDGPRC
jgi:tRNA modification GTPase